jgi:hypothetical protein
VILADPTSYRGLVLYQLWHTANRQIVTFAIPAGQTAAWAQPSPSRSLTESAPELGKSQSNRHLTIDMQFVSLVPIIKDKCLFSGDSGLH